MIPYFQVTEFSLGPISLKAWGTMVALGLLLGIIVSYREAKKRGIDPNQILDVSFWIILGALIGARFFYVLGNVSSYTENLVDAFKVWEGGMTVIGGFVGALVAYWLYIKKKRISFWNLAEPIVFSLPLGIAVGRIGCLFIHDHIGKITSVPWGMEYLDGTVRHETTIYNLLSALILFLIFLISKKTHWSQKQGFYTSLFMVWYGTSRFITDFFRAEDLSVSDSRWLGLTATQYASIIILLGGIYLFQKLIIHKIKTNE